MCTQWQMIGDLFQNMMPLWLKSDHTCLLNLFTWYDDFLCLLYHLGWWNNCSVGENMIGCAQILLLLDKFRLNLGVTNDK
jgi:hypothetical protein